MTLYIRITCDVKFLYRPFSRIVFCAAFALNSQIARAQESHPSQWRGPLNVQNERLLQAIFLHFPATNPDVLGRGQGQWNAQIDIANNLLIPNVGLNGETVREDFETQRLQISYRRGWKRNWEIGAQSSLIARNGGITDGLIDAYHRLLGLEGNGPDNPIGRDNLPNNRTIFEFRDANNQGISVSRALGIGDTDLWLQRQLSGGRLASAFRVGVQIPTGSQSRILGSGSVDTGVVVDARYQFARDWSIFGNAGASVFGNASVPNAKNSGVQGGLGLEWRRGKKASIVAQIDAASRVVTTGNSFADRTPVIASIGYKRDLGQRSSYWFALSENGDYHNYRAPFFGNIGPDTTLSFGYQWRR